MPRRAGTPRKAKYAPTLTRTTDRFVVKLMRDGKKGLAERILRQALARAEASPTDPAWRSWSRRCATPRPSSRSSRAASVAPPTRSRWRSAATAACRWASAGWSSRRASATASRMSEKLAFEFVDAMNGLGAAVKRREDTHKMAEANKAFSHFKW